MKIYTKHGDQGQTGLGNGIRVLKCDVQISAIGSVDELNSVLGVIIAHNESKQLLLKIQNELFSIGADLCSSSCKYEEIDVDIAYLENRIDFFHEFLSPLRNFILPGGSKLSAWFHLARSVCRRAERDVVAFAEKEGLTNEKIIVYLNRLSDLFFTLSRYENLPEEDVIWKGKS